AWRRNPAGRTNQGFGAARPFEWFRAGNRKRCGRKTCGREYRRAPLGGNVSRGTTENGFVGVAETNNSRLTQEAFEMMPDPQRVPESPIYSATFRIFARYWQAYGGWRALFRSLYLHVAIIITCLLWGRWTMAGWWEMPLAVLPNIIGFSVGGYALLLS